MSARTLAAGVVFGMAMPSVLAASGAQTPVQHQEAPPPQSGASAVATLPGGTPEGATPVIVDSRYRYPIHQMEGVLVEAVKQGAQNLADELTAVLPDVTLFTGQAKAHGFPEPGEGVTFVVEIPLIHADSIQLFQQLQEVPVNIGSATNGTGTPVAGSKPAPVPAVLRDPQAVYTIRVRQALVDAMLDWAGPMPLQGDEWLTVVARAVDAGYSQDDVTSILRIKGADLTAYKAGKLSKDEARKKVQLIEF